MAGFLDKGALVYRKIISILLAIAFLFTNTIYAAPSHTKAKLSCLRVPLAFDKSSKPLSDRITTSVPETNSTLASNEGLIPRKLVANIVSGKKTASEILNEINDGDITNEELRNAKSDLYGIIGLADARNFNELQASLISFSKRFNYLSGLGGSQREIYNKMMIAKSILARDAANAYLDNENADAFNALVRKAKDIRAEFIRDKIRAGAIKESENSKIKEADKYIDEWLSEKNMPRYIKQGIVRGMLEGRSDDLIFAFGNGWRQFGTAGIRNQAVNSSFAAVLLLELEEFAQDSHAPVLGGPNLMNAITLLQQTATVKHIISSLRSYIEANPDANEVSLKDLMQYSQLFKRTQAAGQISIENIPDVAIALPEEFKRNLRNNSVTFSYDSRLNGKYLAQVLAADLLDAGIKVDLFENVSGMPSLTRASKIYGSIFGFLISASHSEPNYNGFKFVVGHLMSQVDSNFQKMIMAFRDMIEYDDIALSMALSDPTDSLKRNNKNLTWLGKKEPLIDHENYGAARKDFYTANYEHLKKRSPLAILEERYPELAAKFRQARLEFEMLYTAFSGAGADNAESIKEFLNDMGYASINTVKSQTDEIDGKFPAFINGWKTGMPDPGDVKACAVNIADYILQVAGEDLSRLDAAINSINGMAIAPGATDPDSDRMGAALKLDENTYKGATGNMRNLIISEAEKAMTERGYSEVKIAQVKASLESKLNDKLHLTANDTWSFLTHFKFKILEDQKMLEKDRLYVIIKSHVTTSGLEGVTEYWRNKGYNVHVVDTWVGFTLLAERADLLFNFAKIAWEAISERKDGTGSKAKLKELMPQLEKAYSPIAGQIKAIDNAMRAASLALNEDAPSEQLQDALRRLYMAANIDIVCGVEESNGYGEFGRIQLVEGKPAELVNEHIKEKDGALALYEFMEIMVYLKVMNKSFHSAYLEMMRDAENITATTNSYYRYVGAEGDGQKVGTIQAIEKELAFYAMRAIDHKEAISFFEGRYKFDREKEPVEIFWDDKYDNSYRRFPEEGVRFNLVTEYKGVAYKLTVTYRPSGTGMENRDYNWAIGVISQEATLDQVEAIRRDVEIVREQLVKDFFGEEGVTKGYLDKDKFNGILLAMNEGGFNRFREVFAKALGLDSVPDGSKINLTFTEWEEKLLQGTVSFAFTSRRLKGKITPQAREAYAEQLKTASEANFKLWQEYLSSDEAKSYPNKVTVVVKGKPIAEIPGAMAISWGVSVADYLTTLIENEFGLERSMDIACDIPDLTKLTKQFIEARLSAKGDVVTGSTQKLALNQDIDTIGGENKLRPQDMKDKLASNEDVKVKEQLQLILARLKKENAISQLDDVVYGKSFEEAEALNPQWAKTGFETYKKGKEVSRLGWTLENLRWILKNPGKVQQVLRDAEEIRAKYKYVIFCGMGGSGLSVQTVKTTFGEPKNLTIYSLRTTDPAVIKDILEDIAGKEGSLEAALRYTYAILISKSGTTLETVSHKEYFEGKGDAKGLFERLGIAVKGHMMVVTDKGSPMDTGRHEQREIQLNGKGDIGGRFTSPTTNVFLLPLALVAPEKVKAVLEKAIAVNETSNINNDTFIKLGAYLYHMASKLGKDKVTFMVPQELQDLPMWSEQLFEESLGKDGKGVTIFYGEDISEVSLKDVRKNDRVFLRINIGGKKTNDKLWSRLEKNGYPVFEINVDDIDSIGGIMLGLQRVVATIGYLWDICFVDQPAVEGYKYATRKVMNKLQPGERVEVPRDWKSASFGKLKLYYDRLMQVGAITEKELETEVQRLGAAMDNAPAVYAAIINILKARPGFEAKELTSYGRMTEGMRGVLQSARTDIFTNGLQMPSKFGEGPDKNHSYQQNIEGGKDMWLSTYFMPLEIEQPEALSYDDNLIRAQTLGTVNSIVNGRRKVMLITFDSTTKDAEGDVKLFFDKVDSYLNTAAKPQSLDQKAIRAIDSGV
ncbi:MAG: hypothetical protein KKD90_06600 [Candidatus Omnitrophica bacterium]|nr:hypothetical protein [Candidatus Omnitrophota bacterium]